MNRVVLSLTLLALVAVFVQAHPVQENNEINENYGVVYRGEGYTPVAGPVSDIHNVQAIDDDWLSAPQITIYRSDRK
ncbi:hypothetical protein O3G_MSEX009890 [Manduca sexta]|uniref:Uncharacterized protein n=1 Tax=Manduca sexta TaxID=7130 RepID=A0A921ZF84_MANSE|nr:hypothetical protein O3G_MSEX009890 [Manduca sexta]